MSKELAQADREYDAALAAYNKAYEEDEDDDIILAASRRLTWASDKRASILAALAPKEK